MKKYFYLLGILSLTTSCGTVAYMYDDVYDVAEGKSLTEEGYTDLIKDNEKDHKVVVDKKEPVTFGGYYPSNNQQLGGTSFSTNNNNCNCACGHHSYSNQWRYVQPGWIYGNPNSLWFNNCSCNHWNNNLAYHYFSFGNSYNLYGYYDYWGGWNSYYPLGMDPYGYYAYIYGWYPYQWNNGNNVNFNGGFNSYDNTVDNGNHFYGHRNPSSTSSSNTTVYAHTVKEVFANSFSGGTNQTAVNVENSSGLATGSSGISNKPAFITEESTITPQPFVTGFISEPSVVYQSQKPISTNTSVVSDHTTVATTTNTYAGGSASTNGTSGTTSHVAASNQFEVKHPSGTASRTGSGQTSGTQQADPVNQNTGTPNYYYTPPVVTNTSGYSSTNSTSRSTSTTYNSTNTNTNTSNSYSGSNSTTSHRTSTTSTNSSSGSTTSSGGSRTTTTSRR
jgi:hypothetical protein